MTSLLLARVGLSANGQVIAFEAHPQVFKELIHDTSLWQRNFRDS